MVRVIKANGKKKSSTPRRKLAKAGLAATSLTDGVMGVAVKKQQGHRPPKWPRSNPDPRQHQDAR